LRIHGLLPFGFYASASSPDYQYTDSVGNKQPNQPHDSGVPLTSGGLHLAFTLTGASTYSFSITPLSDPSATSTVIEGSLALETINAISFENQDAGPSLSNALFFNSIAVVPEPGGFAVLMTVPLLLARHRRGVTKVMGI
jgi:hypothetical protein